MPPPMVHGYPAGLLSPTEPERRMLQSVNRWARPSSSASSSSAIMCCQWGRTPFSTTASRCGDRSRDGGRSPPTTAPTPPGTASAAPGSRRGSRRSLCCGVCAVSASSRSFQRTNRRALSPMGTAWPSSAPVRELLLSAHLQGVWANPLRAGPQPSPTGSCVRPFLLPGNRRCLRFPGSNGRGLPGHGDRSSPDSSTGGATAP